MYNRELNGKVALITFDDNSMCECNSSVWMTTKQIEKQVCAVQSVGAVGVIFLDKRTLRRAASLYMTQIVSSASAIPVLIVPHCVCEWLGANDDDDDDVGRAVGVFKTVVFQPGQ